MEKTISIVQQMMNCMLECEEYALFLWEVIFTSRDMFLTDQVLLESSYVGNG